MRSTGSWGTDDGHIGNTADHLVDGTLIAVSSRDGSRSDVARGRSWIPDRDGSETAEGPPSNFDSDRDEEAHFP